MVEKFVMCCIVTILEHSRPTLQILQFATNYFSAFRFRVQLRHFLVVIKDNPLAYALLKYKFHNFWFTPNRKYENNLCNKKLYNLSRFAKFRAISDFSAGFYTSCILSVKITFLKEKFQF